MALKQFLPSCQWPSLCLRSLVVKWGAGWQNGGMTAQEQRILSSLIICARHLGLTNMTFRPVSRFVWKALAANQVTNPGEVLIELPIACDTIEETSDAVVYAVRSAAKELGCL